jgi:hypothetical protein
MIDHNIKPLQLPMLCAMRLTSSRYAASTSQSYHMIAREAHLRSRHP